MKVIDLSFHLCNSADAEKGFGGPLSVRRGEDLDNYFAFCLDDPSLIRFRGTLESHMNKILRVQLLRCTDKPYCKSDEEIEMFLSQYQKIRYWYPT